jgi:polar amino acid transport system substrate-binding protein
MPQEIVSQLAPTGVLRAAINMANFLLVTGRVAAGELAGVAPAPASRARGPEW